MGLTTAGAALTAGAFLAAALGAGAFLAAAFGAALGAALGAAALAAGAFFAGAAFGAAGFLAAILDSFYLLMKEWVCLSFEQRCSCSNNLWYQRELQTLVDSGNTRTTTFKTKSPAFLGLKQA